MRLITQLQNNHGIIKVEGSLSNENLQDLEDALSTLLNKDRNILLDLFDVAFICSSALSLLLNYTKKAQKNNMKLIIYGLNEDIKKLFLITELDKHLAIVANLKEAKAGIGPPPAS